jgi:AraC family transcriptional regulator
MKKLSEASRREYVHRINLVLDYIDQHLEENITLDQLAQVASFSKYHFHRLFYVFIGETLYQYIRRLRLEKACTLLLGQANLSITEIAFLSGFSTPSGFTRSFSDVCGVSPSQWKEDQLKKSNCETLHRNFDQVHSKNGNAHHSNRMYATTIQSQRSIDMKDHDVVVKECPEKTVAYVRYIGPYKDNPDLFESLSNQLCTWAGPRNLLRFPETEFIIVYHDNPEITEESKLRISVCITVPSDTQVDGEIGKMTIPAGTYAFSRFRLGSTGYQEAWDWMCGQWLPSSGYAPDDKPCYEQYYGSPKDSPDGKMDVDIVIPVKPL